MTNHSAGESPYFSSLFRNTRINALIHMDTGGIIKAINPAFKNFFGYTDEDLAGRHFSMLFTDEDQIKGKPWTEIEKVLADGQADDKNFLVHKNGKISWVSGESILIEHANGDRDLLKMLQDIQEQKESEVSLSRVTDFNELILNAIDDFVIVLDKEMNVLQFNPAFTRLFKNKAHLPITDFAAFIHPYDKQEELRQKILATINTGHPLYKQLIEIITVSGERVFEVNCQAIQVSGNDNIAILTGHDITIQKRADLEREDLMGFVAHELRNPLASIMMSNGLITLLVKEHGHKELDIILERNKKNIERLNNMVAELYNAAKVSGGDFLLEKTSFDFDDMVIETVETFRLMHPDYVFIIEGKAGKTVLADRYRIQQVVSNYLSNAVKYADAPSAIKIIVTTEGRNIIAAVEDHGAGIDPEQMPYLFDRFFRAEKTRSREGLGLGLYLCRRVIDAHSGKVWAERKAGKGSVFYFSLPGEL